MSGLTREEIAELWKKAMQSSAKEFVGFLRQGLVPNHAHPENLTLPERFALLLQDRQSLSQEAVRDEALDQGDKLMQAKLSGFNEGLEEAARECGLCASRQADRHDQKVRDQTRRDLAAAIRALKREPNAALPEGFRAIDDVVSEIERDPTRKGELDKAREHLRQFVSPAPESPLVERLEAAGRDERLSTGALYLEAATALSLAQTEIKGHMRVEDDLETENVALREERDKHYTRLAGLLFSGALDKYTGGDVQSWAAEYTEKLDQAQARIAELEKLLRECLEMANNWPGIAYSYDLEGRCLDALKDRA